MKFLLWPVTNQTSVPADLRRSRLFFANGTEMTGVHSVGLVKSEAVDTLENRMAGRHCPPPRRPVNRLIIEFEEPEVEILEALPPNLAERLHALAAKWSAGSSGSSADRENTAAEVARETCAEELEALLDEVKRC